MRMPPHTRASYIRKGAQKFADLNSSAVVYASEDERGCYLVAFHGKAQKPDFNYRYPNSDKGRARREARAQEHFLQWQGIERRKSERQAERRAWVHDYKPGDVFSTHWGYEQTNREYWQCVEVRGKHLIVRQIGCEYEETGWCSGQSVPALDNFISEPSRVLAQPFGFREPTYQHIASRMDPVAIIGGKPVFAAKYESSYG